MACPVITSSVVVKSRKEGKSVFYDIFADANVTSPLKTTRFSEIAQLQASVTREVPSFRGRLPAKTFGRNTSPAFIESRRVELQQYFVAIAGNNAVCHSDALQKYFADVMPTTNSIMSEAQGMMPSSPDVYEEPPVPTLPAVDEDKAMLDSSLDKELMRQLMEKNDIFQQAASTKSKIQGSVASGDSANQAKVTEAEQVAAMQLDAADRLAKHRASLETLRGILDGKRSKQADKEAEQTAVMARLSEEIIQAAQQTKEKRSRLETARRAREETAAAVQANIDACMDAFALASAVHTAAVEHHTAMKAAVQRLNEHVTTRTSAVALAEVELETRQAAVASQEAESAQAIEMRRQAESALRVAKAALDSHTQDAARRARAHEVEVRRAEERSTTATTLRDMATRRSLQDEDSASLAEIEKKARDAAESATQALSAAKERRNTARQTDAATSAKLYATVEKVTSDFGKRQHMAATVAARLSANKKVAADAAKAHGCAVASLKSVTAELALQKSRAEGELEAEVAKTSESLQSCAEELENARKLQTEAPQRHAQDAEALVLQRQEEVEAHLIQAVNEARIKAAEAHDDAQEVDDESSGAQELDLLLTSAIGHFDDRQKLSQETAQAYQDAVKTVEQARTELEEAKKQLAQAEVTTTEGDASEDAHVELKQRVASAEATVANLDEVADERKSTHQAAHAAVQAAAEELKALEEQQKLTPKVIVPLDLVVRGELETVSELIDRHKQAHSKLLEEAKAASADWAAKRQELSVSLHTASLQVAVAEDAVEATKELRKRVTGGL